MTKEYDRLKEKYDLLVKQTAVLLETLIRLKNGELSVDDIDLKAGQEE